MCICILINVYNFRIEKTINFEKKKRIIGQRKFRVTSCVVYAFCARQNGRWDGELKKETVRFNNNNKRNDGFRDSPTTPNERRACPCAEPRALPWSDRGTASRSSLHLGYRRCRCRRRCRRRESSTPARTGARSPPPRTHKRTQKRAQTRAQHVTRGRRAHALPWSGCRTAAAADVVTCRPSRSPWPAVVLPVARQPIAAAPVTWRRGRRRSAGHVVTITPT